MASGTGSFAAGQGASDGNNAGVFVWADGTQSTAVPTSADQFDALASGGVNFYTSKDFSTGASLGAGDSAWAVLSDRNAKANLKAVDGKDILRRLAAVPIQTWNYKAQAPSIRHMGPMAQDFRAAFRVGEDDKHITTVDADGVTMAAIQGLYAMIQEVKQKDATLERRLGQKEAELGQVKQQVRSQQAKLDALEREEAALKRTTSMRPVNAAFRASSSVPPVRSF